MEGNSQWRAALRAGAGGGACSSLPAAGAFVVGMPVLLLTLDGAVRRVPAAVVHGLLLTVVAPLFLLGLGDELLVLRHQFLHLLHQLLFTLLFHLFALPLHIGLCSTQGFTDRLTLLLLHLRPQLFQSFPDDTLRLSLVVGLHHLLDVIKDFGVLLVAHVLARSGVAVGLRAAVQGPRAAATGLLCLSRHR